MAYLLANQNPHARDAAISFEAGPHKYTIAHDTSTSYTSVTTWNHSHFATFDADDVIQRMMNNPRTWPQSPYFGMTPDAIKAIWEKNRDEAALLGTQMHHAIECYYNGLAIENGTDKSVEFTYFKRFIDAFPALKPYRTEWMIYHEELKLAGSIDIVYENEADGTLWIYDWKRAKDIKKSCAFNKCATTECISHLPDTNFWHYALQLNTYKGILEQKYDKIVSKMALVCLHPSKPSYQVLTVPDLSEEISALFSLRMKML